jgi:hypothetical protein
LVWISRVIRRNTAALDDAPLHYRKRGNFWLKLSSKLASQLGQVKATGSDLVRKTVRGHPGNMEMIRRGASQFA